MARLDLRIPSGKMSRAGQAAPKLLWEGGKEEQERWAVLTWTLTLCSVAFQPWSSHVWTGAVPSSGPGQDRGVGRGKKCWGCTPTVPKELETLPKRAGNTPKGAGAVGSRGALLSRIQVVSCVQQHLSPAGIPNLSPFLCMSLPQPSPGSGRAQGPGCGSCTRLVTLL